MITLTLSYIIAVIVGVTIIGILAGGSKKKILIAIPVSIFGVPIFFGGLLFILKGPIQEGKILQNTTLGPLLNLIAPPPDLYNPLSSIKLEPEKTEYVLNFSNKYLGNHGLLVSSSDPAKEEYPDYSDISVTFSVFDGQKELFKMGPERASQFSGLDDYGAFLTWYKVPRDLPVSKQLTAKVVFSGNLKGFLERRGHTELKIEKFSDE